MCIFYLKNSILKLFAKKALLFFSPDYSQMTRDFLFRLNQFVTNMLAIFLRASTSSFFFFSSPTSVQINIRKLLIYF